MQQRSRAAGVVHLGRVGDAQRARRRVRARSRGPVPRRARDEVARHETPATTRSRGHPFDHWRHSAARSTPPARVLAGPARRASRGRRRARARSRARARAARTDGLRGEGDERVARDVLEVAVDPDLAVDPHEDAGEAAGAEQQRRFDQQDALQASGRDAREAQLGQRHAPLPDRGGRARSPARGSRRAIKQRDDLPELAETRDGDRVDFPACTGAVDTSSPLAGPSARTIAAPHARGVRARGELDPERGRRRGCPVAPVVGGAHQDHARAPADVGRGRGDPEADVPGGGRQRQMLADADVIVPRRSAARA